MSALLGTPFQLGQSIQFDHADRDTRSWKPFRSNSGHGCLYGYAGQVDVRHDSRLPGVAACSPNVMAHGWLTYAPQSLSYKSRRGIPKKPANKYSVGSDHESREQATPEALPRWDKEVPGPGQYQLPCCLQTGPTFTMASRLHHPDSASVAPGPGTYDHLQGSLHCGPAFTLAARQPTFTAQSDAPGPGTYYHHSQGRLTGGEGPAYTMAARPPQAAASSTAAPGPGQYADACAAAADAGPAYSFVKARRASFVERGEGPAPGAYDPAAPVHAPAWTMPMAPRRLDPDAEDPTPAPGEYSSYMPSSGFAFTIPAAPKEPKVSVYGPGPGEYAPPAPKPGPAFSMAPRCGTAAAADSNQPGPGEYEAEPLARAPAFTFAGRHAEPPGADRGTSAGPAEYNLPCCFPSGPAFSVPKAAPQQSVAADTTVGPQSYEPHAISPAAPAFTIQGRTQQARDPEPVPGPADYTADMRATKPCQPAYTIAARHQPQRYADADCTPGPGEFSGLGPAATGPAYTIPAARPASPRGYGPGPGEYCTDAAAAPQGPAYTIPRAAHDGRGGGTRDEEHLGPGAYDPRQLHGGPAFTMGCMVGERIVPGQAAPDAAEMPGPQDYDAAALPAGPAYTHGVRRAAPDRSAAAEGIGPGAYEAPGVAVGPAFTIQGRRPATTDTPSDAPGPGAYGDGMPQNKGPAFSMPQARRHVAADSHATAAGEMPGPGEYGVAALDTGPAYTIPAAADAAAPTAAAPGPGEYIGVEACAAPQGPAYTIPQAGATACASVADPSPGPGAYGMPAAAAEGPAFTIAARWPEGARPAEADQPGPQDYAPAPPAPGPAFTMPGKPAANASAAAAVPGPGEYCVSAAVGEGPAFTLGSRLPAAATAADATAPGPADYSTQDLPKTGPAYTIAAKPSPGAPAARSSMPGPGEYEPPATGTGAAFTMGQRVDGAKCDAGEVPGPAEYEVPPVQRGAAFTMAGKHGGGMLDGRPDSGVGPGEYHKEKEPEGPAFSMPVARRGSREAKEVTAGPGEYQGGELHSSGAAFTIGQKPKPRRGAIKPDPGQYEGMHAVPRFPHHGKGPFFERPPVEPLFGPTSAHLLGDIVSTFLGPAQRSTDGGPVGKSPRRRGPGDASSRAQRGRTAENSSMPDSRLAPTLKPADLLKAWNDRQLRGGQERG
eukprot:jgi/Ulvmu1/7147/UM034_0053.1